MPEHVAREAAAPSQLRPSQQPVEKLPVQAFEQFLEIAVNALGPGEKLAAADLPDQMHLPPDVAAVQIQTVAVSVRPRHFDSIKLAQQNVSQGFGDRRRRALQQVGNSHIEASPLETD